MKIEKYTILPEPACPWLFFISEEVERTKETGETYKTTQNIAYGLTFKKALHIIKTLAADKSSVESFIRDYERIEI
jgi:hypothetical protein